MSGRRPGGRLRPQSNQRREDRYHGNHHYLHRSAGSLPVRDDPSGAEGSREEAARHCATGRAHRVAGGCGSSRPDWHPSRRRCNPAAGSGAAALWPDAAIAVHVLPWLRRRHGSRFGTHAGERHQRDSNVWSPPLCSPPEPTGSPTRTAATRRLRARAAIAEKCVPLLRWACSTSGTPGSTIARSWRCCPRIERRS